MYFIFDIDGTICFGDNKISEKILILWKKLKSMDIK